MATRMIAFATGAVLVALVGCDAKVEGAGSGGAEGTSAVKASGGTIAGTAVTSDGRPLETFVVGYEGWPEGALGSTDANGRVVSPASGKVDGKGGKYEIKVPPGQYTTEGMAVVTWHDRPFHFALETADGSDDKSRTAVTANEGVTRNYVWKLTGVRKGRDAGYVGSGWDRNFHGATIHFNARETDTKEYKPVRPGLRESDPKGEIEFTLVPKGKLIDGSEGKTVVEKVAIAKDGQYGAGIRGIPTGDYTLSAKLLKPDGGTEPLRIALEAPGYTKDRTFAWKESVEVVFEPEATGPMKYYGTKPMTVFVGK